MRDPPSPRHCATLSTRAQSAELEQWLSEASEDLRPFAQNPSRLYRLQCGKVSRLHESFLFSIYYATMIASHGAGVFSHPQGHLILNVTKTLVYKKLMNAAEEILSMYRDLLHQDLFDTSLVQELMSFLL